MQNEHTILTDGERKLLDALPWAAVVLDDRGMITDSNEVWDQAVGQPHWVFPDRAATDYFEHCAGNVAQGNDYALRLLFSIQEVLEGIHQKRELKVDGMHPGSDESYRITITSLQKRQPAVLMTLTNMEIRKKPASLSGDRHQKSPESEMYFSQTVLNSIPGIFLVINEELQLVKWNQQLNHELGYKDGELHQLNMIELLGRDDKEWVQNVLEHIFVTGSGNFTAGLQPKGEGVRPYHLCFNRFRIENRSFLAATAADKTDHLVVQMEKERNYELMSQLFENSPLAIIMIGPDGRVIKANRGFEDLFGYKNRELTGKNINPMITEEEYLEEAEEINREAFGRVSHQIKTVRRNKRGERIPVILNTVPIYHDENLIALFGIYVDMRKQVSLERSLQRTIAEKDTLLQEIHHRVKNNLAVVVSLLDLQILQEENREVTEKLSEVSSRIHAIAEIHESLYQARSIVMVDFGQYLKSFNHKFHGFPQVDFQLESTEDLGHSFHLNMNQAVPLGLVIHELIRFSKKNNLFEPGTIRIRLSRRGLETEITIRGLRIFSEKTLRDKQHTYQYMLLKTFLQQIDATISKVGQPDEILIRFKRNDKLRGTNNALL